MGGAGALGIFSFFCGGGFGSFVGLGAFGCFLGFDSAFTPFSLGRSGNVILASMLCADMLWL